MIPSAIIPSSWEVNIATADVKKVIKIGGSLAIILPYKWARGKVRPGQEMVVVGNGELRIIPIHDEAEQNKDEAHNRAKG